MSNFAFHNDSFTNVDTAFNPLAPGNRVLGNYPDGIVIRPGPKTANEQMTYNQLIIDSRDRDKTLYPKPNDYVIHLKSPIRDVVSLEMLQICIPKSEDLINDNNNQFTFQETQDQIDNGSYTTASVPNGQYQLVDELCDGINGRHERSLHDRSLVHSHSRSFDKSSEHKCNWRRGCFWSFQ